MKRITALLLLISIALSLVSCTMTEPPQPSETPEDEGFEQGYKMEFVKTVDYGIGVIELAAYADVTPDIMAYRSEISSFTRSEIDSVTLEISYGTLHQSLSSDYRYKGLDAYNEFQSIPKFEIVLLHPDYVKDGELEPYILAEHNEQLIDEKYSYTLSAFGTEGEGNYGYISEYNNSETVEIPVEYFSGERFGSFTLWARGENELDGNSLVYKYAADIFYLVDGDRITLCSYHRFLKRLNQTDTTPEEANEMFVLYYRSSPLGNGYDDGYTRPLTILADSTKQDSIQLVFSFGWNYFNAYNNSLVESDFSEFNCESYDIIAAGEIKTVNEVFGVTKNTYISANRVLELPRMFYRNQYLVNIPKEKILTTNSIVFGLHCCDEHKISGLYGTTTQRFSVYDNIVVFKYSHQG